MTDLQQERLQVLKMLEETQITVDEAATLLNALDSSAQQTEKAQRSTGVTNLNGRWLRVRVTEGKTGKAKVNVNLPLGFVNVALKLGSRFVPEMQDMDMEEIKEELNAAIESGMLGKVVEVEDAEDGEHVEIYIE